MEQLLLHLIGDYLTQTDWMAKNKTHRIGVAALHVTVYTLPFLLLSPSMRALAVMFASHVLIDRYRLARYVIYAKNRLTEPGLRWADASKTGYRNDMPPWLSVWLLIIADNTIHLAINYTALRWL